MGRVAGSDRMCWYIYGNTYLVYAYYVCELVSMWRSTRKYDVGEGFSINLQYYSVAQSQRICDFLLKKQYSWGGAVILLSCLGILVWTDRP